MQDTFARARAHLHTRYPIVARSAWPTGCRLCSAFRPSASREQRYLAYKLCTRALSCMRSSFMIQSSWFFVSDNYF